MPAGPVIIDLTHRDAPIEISDDSDSDDAELPVAIEPPQPVSSSVRQRNVNERRTRLLQRGIDEEAEERERQRQIARDEQIARRLQAMGGEGDIDVIQISSGEDTNDDSDGGVGRSSSPEDIHADARRFARLEREWQELNNSPPRRRYPHLAGPSNSNENIPQAGPSNASRHPIPMPDYIPNVPAPPLIRRLSRPPSRPQFHAQNHAPPPPPTADELIGRARFQSPAPRLGLGGGGIFSNRHQRTGMTMHQRSVVRERTIVSLARDGLGGFLRGWGEGRSNNGEDQGGRGGLEGVIERADDPPEVPPMPPRGLRAGLGNLLRMRIDPPQPHQPFVYGAGPPAPELPDAPEYRPEFTHPKGFVKPGFSGDFERRTEPEVVDLDAAASAASWGRKGKGKAKAVTPPPLKPLKLVCASCKSRLKVNGEEEERVYGLRCGHVLDGTCVAKMAFPLDPVAAPLPAVDEDTKGKGKATFEEVNIHTLNQDQQPQEEEGIAARLRPRATRGGRGRGRGRGGARGGAKGKKRKGRKNATVNATPAFEQFEWKCPVAGCGRAHFSVRAVVTGAPWKHDARRGAVGIFV